MSLRWGIAGTGKISHDFVCAVHVLPSADHEVHTVAARSLKSAQDFASRHNIKNYLEGYEALAKSDVDIVYIGVIKVNHLEVAKLMLKHGKHILCEKPLTMNKKQSTELLKYAKGRKLFLMEAIWSRAFPAYIELQRQIKNGSIGDVLYCHVHFGIPIEGLERVNSKELGGGTILDLGVYALQFSQYVFRGLKPDKFVGAGYLYDNGVDASANAIIQYPGSKSATLAISSKGLYPNEAVVVGTKGTICVPSFWSPSELITPKETLKFDLPETKDTFNFGNSVGLCYEAEECRKCIKSGLLENPSITHAESLQLAEMMDTWRKAVGVTYEADNA